MVPVLAGREYEWGQAGWAPAANEKPDVVLESVKTGTRSVQFHVEYGADSAVVVFSVENDSGRRDIPTTPPSAIRLGIRLPGPAEPRRRRLPC